MCRIANSIFRGYLKPQDSMNHYKQRKISTKNRQVIFLMLLLWIVGCSGGGSAAPGSSVYSISGTVSGEVQSGVTVTLTDGKTTLTKTTDENGKYSFTIQTAGQYTVTPSTTIYNTFTPSSSTVTVSGENVTVNNFTAVISLTELNLITLREKQTKQLTAPIHSRALTNTTWMSSDSSIVTVSSTGLVTAIAVGKATVSEITSDGNAASTYSVDVVSPDRLIVIIKADDFQASIMHSFKRLFEVCKLVYIPISAGLVMNSLQTAAASQIEFLANLDPQECELWIHGYTHYMDIPNGTTEFKGPDKDTQIATLKKCIDVSQSYLKRDLSVFGAPGNAADSSTSAALDTFPSIKTVFFQPLGGNRLVLTRSLFMEYSTGKTYNHSDVIDKANKLPAGSVAVMQIHPNAWGEMEWSEFVLTIQALKNNGVVFMTPSEYTKWVER
jgi:hypothetical protein